MPLIRARSPVLSCASCCTVAHASRRAPAASTPFTPTRIASNSSSASAPAPWRSRRSRPARLPPARSAVRAAPGHARLRRRARFRRHRRRAARDRGLFDPWRSTGSLASHSATPRAAAWPPCASSTRRSAASGLRLAAARNCVEREPAVRRVVVDPLVVHHGPRGSRGRRASRARPPRRSGRGPRTRSARSEPARAGRAAGCRTPPRRASRSPRPRAAAPLGPGPAGGPPRAPVRDVVRARGPPDDAQRARRARDGVERARGECP